MTTKPQPNIKKILLSVIAVAVLAAGVLIASPNKDAAAAGSTVLSISPTGGTYTVGDTFTVTVNENSGSETVNTVTAYVKYDHAALQAISVDTSGSPFDSGPAPSTTGTFVTIAHGIGTAGATVTSTQKVGTITFKVLAASSSSALSFDASSLIINPYTGSNTWNGSTSTAASYTLKAAAVVTPPSTPTTPSTPSGGSSSSGPKNNSTGGSTNTKPSGGSSSTSNSSTGNTNTAPATTPTVDNPQVLEDSGYIVAVKIVNDKNKPVEGATVVLNGKTTKTAKTGVASFIDVPAGSYSVKVTYSGKTQTQKVTVAKQEAAQQNPQSFKVKFVSKKSAPWPIYLVVLLVIIGLGVAGFLIPRKNKFQPPSAPTGGTPVISSEPVNPPAVATTIHKETTPDPTQVGQIVRPTIITPDDVKEGPQA